jgi:hypothetical protein
MPIRAVQATDVESARDHMRESRATLSAMQTFMLQGVFAAVVVGACLPIGLVAFFLAIRAAPLAEAVRYGELYLSGGNAAVVGCVCLMAARPEKAVNSAIAALFAVTLIVGPCYAGAAYFSVQGVIHQSASRGVAVAGGAVAAIVGICIALGFVWMGAYRPETGN